MKFFITFFCVSMSLLGWITLTIFELKYNVLLKEWYIAIPSFLVAWAWWFLFIRLAEKFRESDKIDHLNPEETGE